MRGVRVVVVGFSYKTPFGRRARIWHGIETAAVAMAVAAAAVVWGLVSLPRPALVMVGAAVPAVILLPLSAAVAVALLFSASFDNHRVGRRHLDRQRAAADAEQADQ